MGRPLNKKYFGNRNLGGTGTSDNGIGGASVASVTVTAAGAYVIANAPTALNFSNPLLEGIGGVRATGTATYQVISATISGGTGYGNAQTFNLTVNTAGGTAVLNVTSTAGGAITTVNSITTAGTFTGISAVTSVSGGTGNNDAVPVLTYGVKAITVTEKGSGYLGASYASGTITGTTTSTDIVTVNSTAQLFPGASLAVTGTTIGNISAGTYFVHSVLSATTVKLSTTYANFKAGTVMAQTTATGSMAWVASQHLIASLTSASGSPATLTQVLAASTSALGASQEKAIVALAFIPAANGGTRAVEGDIIKQDNTRSYKVETSEGTGICKLKTSGAVSAAGEMTIKATDQAGKTYYVAKLTARFATLVPFGTSGHQFPQNADGTYLRAKWTFGSAVAPSGSETGVVTIENA